MGVRDAFPSVTTESRAVHYPTPGDPLSPAEEAARAADARERALEAQVREDSITAWLEALTELEKHQLLRSYAGLLYDDESGPFADWGDDDG